MILATVSFEKCLILKHLVTVFAGKRSLVNFMHVCRLAQCTLDLFVLPCDAFCDECSEGIRYSRSWIYHIEEEKRQDHNKCATAAKNNTSIHN